MTYIVHGWVYRGKGFSEVVEAPSERQAQLIVLDRALKYFNLSCLKRLYFRFVVSKRYNVEKCYDKSLIKDRCLLNNCRIKNIIAEV